MCEKFVYVLWCREARVSWRGEAVGKARALDPVVGR